MEGTVSDTDDCERVDSPFLDITSTPQDHVSDPLVTTAADPVKEYDYTGFSLHELRAELQNVEAKIPSLQAEIAETVERRQERKRTRLISGIERVKRKLSALGVDPDADGHINREDIVPVGDVRESDDVVEEQGISWRGEKKRVRFVDEVGVSEILDDEEDADFTSGRKGKKKVARGTGRKRGNKRL